LACPPSLDLIKFKEARTVGVYLLKVELDLLLGIFLTHVGEKSSELIPTDATRTVFVEALEDLV